MFPTLNFPQYAFKIKKTENGYYVFDPVRKKLVKLTPEEWVRQHVIKFLSEDLQYPISHMVSEKSLSIHTLTKRADLLVYDQMMQPALLVECKAPGIKMTSKVFEQIAAYNLAFNVPWLFITNGLNHFFAHINHVSREVKNISFIPDYPQLVQE